MQAFDWSRVWEGDSVLVELTRQERALLLQHCTNVLSTPSTFLTGYDEDTDLESINDFLQLLQFHLLNTPAPSSIRMIDIVVLCANGAPSGGTLTFTSRPELPFAHTMFTDTTANRYITNTIWLKAGTYAYIGWYTKNTSSGIIDLEIWNASGYVLDISSNIDQYANALGGRFSISTSFTITTDGFYTILPFNHGTKNALSSAFSVNWSSHHIRQTA